MRGGAMRDVARLKLLEWALRDGWRLLCMLARKVPYLCFLYGWRCPLGRALAKLNSGRSAPVSFGFP